MKTAHLLAGVGAIDLLLAAGLGAAIVLGAGHCQGPDPTPHPVWPPPGASSAAPAPAAPPCVAACDHLAALGCPEAQPSPRGVSCAVTLSTYAATPAGVDCPCLAAVVSCGQTARCGR